jgi:TRAP-type C4-dicarboxylate transport system substrate-binding protein
MYRRLSRIALASFFLVVVAQMQAAATDFKIATVAPEGSQWMQEIRRAAAEIKERSEGRVVLKLYGGGVMGNEKQVLRKIRIGQLHGGAFTAGGLAEKYPDIVLYGLPLVFNDLDEVDFVRSKLDATLSRGLEEAGFVSFGFAGGGFARIFARKAIVGTADMRGQKIWIPEGDRVSAVAMEALKLAPVGLPVTDVLTGLQTGLLDVVAAPPVAVIALQWHTRVQYMTETPLMYTMGLMAVDARAFARLSQADQQIFREVMGSVYKRFDAQSRADEQSAMQALEASNISVVDAMENDVAAWRAAADTANEQLGREGMYTPALFSQLQQLLVQHRQGVPTAVVPVVR